MTRDGDTIVALSSGSLPSGVAVIRLSGPSVAAIVRDMAGDLPKSRNLCLRTLQVDNRPIDQGLVAFFPGPQSFTGEDCAEFQVHGSPAVIRALLRALPARQNVRLADAGEFTRRAFENGKLDLTEVEGLGDLLDAETESQRVQAFARMAGGISDEVATWRAQLLDLRAEIEARLDFSDEGDVADTLPEDWLGQLQHLRADIGGVLAGAGFGRIVREGFRVALAGPPNAGKSSLINALSKSDLAIVSDEAGTTRDVREVPLDLGGALVIFVDMAGLRETQSRAEAEGVRRAEDEIGRADLVLWLEAADSDELASRPTIAPLWTVGTKADLGTSGTRDQRHSVSTVTGAGLESLLADITRHANEAGGSGVPMLVSRERDRLALESALQELDRVEAALERPELAAEHLRAAADALARLTGHMDSEAVLDRLFAGFCIGK